MIAEMIKTLREQHDLTQQEASDGLNMKLSTYKNYEYGRREPDLNTVVEIAKFYDISTDELLGIPSKEKADDPIVALCEACNFNMTERAIITAYCAMDGKQRKNFMDQISQFSKMVHNACLEAVQTVPDEQPEESTQSIVQEQTTQEAANNTEQIADEAQQVEDATIQEEITQPIAQERDSPEEEQFASPIRISQEPTIQSEEAEMHIKRNVAVRKDIKKKASRNGEKPFVRVLTEAQKDEIRSRPRADEDM